MTGVSAALVRASNGTTTQPDPDKVSPGLLGFLVIFALALVTVLLVRSMVGHLRKVRYSTPPEGVDGAEGTHEGASGR